jgi:hypothetical protein
MGKSSSERGNKEFSLSLDSGRSSSMSAKTGSQRKGKGDKDKDKDRPNQGRDILPPMARTSTAPVPVPLFTSLNTIVKSHKQVHIYR